MKRLGARTQHRKHLIAQGVHEGLAVAELVALDPCGQPTHYFGGGVNTDIGAQKLSQ